MKIHIVSGTGSGPTKLAAFDTALVKAGIANHNLIYLSSVIPPGSEIIQEKRPLNSKLGNWGDRLYVVMAEIRVAEPNTEACAGIGWVQGKDTAKGFFAEHVGENEKTVRRDIEQSLKTFMSTRKLSPRPINMKLASIVCKTEPVCALVAAVFQAENWT